MERIVAFSDFRIFQTKRFKRLYPLHFVMLVAFLGVEAAKYLATNKLGLLPSTPAFSVSDPYAFFANLLLVQNWLLADLTFNYPSWSISAEFYTYAIFGLFYILLRGRFFLRTVILITTTLLLAIALSHFGFSADNISGPLRCLYSFTIGNLVYVGYSLLQHHRKFRSSSPSSFFLFLSVIVVTSYASKGFDFLVLIPLLFGASIFVLVLTDTKSLIHRLLSHRWLVYLGTISYGIYMIHALVWWIYSQTLKFVFGFPQYTDQLGYVRVNVESLLLGNLLVLSFLALTITLAHLSYRFLEQRFYKS